MIEARSLYILLQLDRFFASVGGRYTRLLERMTRLTFVDVSTKRCVILRDQRPTLLFPLGRCSLTSPHRHTLRFVDPSYIVEQIRDSVGYDIQES